VSIHSLSEIRTAVHADDVFLFVFDYASGAIRYLSNDGIVALNRGNGAGHEAGEQREAMAHQRIPPKVGIIGHMAFCGSPQLVESLDQDPRRCLADDDMLLGLNSVMFYPLVQDTFLWGVVMVNRRGAASGSFAAGQAQTFRQTDFSTYRRVAEAHQQPVIEMLQRFSASSGE
jgi:hypothetical protein